MERKPAEFRLLGNGVKKPAKTRKKSFDTIVIEGSAKNKCKGTDCEDIGGFVCLFFNRFDIKQQNQKGKKHSHNASVDLPRIPKVETNGKVRKNGKNEPNRFNTLSHDSFKGPVKGRSNIFSKHFSNNIGEVIVTDPN